MQLHKHIVDIEHAVFDTRTYVDGHTLHICKEELQDVIADSRFLSVGIELAFPGEDCRLMNVGDIVQPIYKTTEGGASFPGVVDDIEIGRAS